MDTVLEELYATLDARSRPEEVADLILSSPRIRLTKSQRAVLERAARHSWRRTGGFSSMTDDFARPVGAERQLATLGRLFDGGLPADALDPGELRRAAARAGEQIRWSPGETDFLDDRLTRAGRAAAGIDLPKRQYNRRWRFLVRLSAKIDRIDTELRKRELMLVGRSGLAADITLERFRADPDAAAFVAYFVARRNLRRQFTLSGKTSPFDQVAEMLLGRCRPASTDWWMISRAYGAPEVVARLTPYEQGELLGRWSALMRGAAGILADRWFPDVDRSAMIVRRGMDSSTWNTVAQAYNTARAGWLTAVAALGAESLLDVACPGKAMRLMAGDLAAWHSSTGGGVDPDTLVWATLPLPWEVLSGEASCTRETVAAACRAQGVDPERRGWTAPRATGVVARFTPTPELVHGVAVRDPLWAAVLRRSGAYSGKR
ncbi:hypothetical protein [Actinoplanes sp. RD1]|uniref:hypothetical protein n=1 Tax=Actinoplanes sp. RD1 TaxID=3064538 RepID=UPI0027420ECB|nr:hypothetical protein [Actinoplanes sp. RD1]